MEVLSLVHVALQATLVRGGGEGKVEDHGENHQQCLTASVSVTGCSLLK